MNLLVFTNSKDETYNSIPVIVKQFQKMIYYKPVKVTINTSGLVKVIIKTKMRHHGLFGSIVIDRGWVFNSKF